MKAIVVGGSGMFGSALVSLLSRNGSVDVYATYRTPWTGAPPGAGVKKWFMFHSGSALPPSVEVSPGDWIINAAGAIPHRNPSDLDMVRANALLPYELADLAERSGARMVNVTTDCVFLGKRTGRTALNLYHERSEHDAESLYGRTKSLGEIRGAKHVFNLRCSIVGPEPGGRGVSLMEWFLSRPEGTKVAGYKDHYWNGVTTLALARVVEGLMLYEDCLIEYPSIHHLVPHDVVPKSELLRIFGRAFGHNVEVEDKAAGGVDRTLGTRHHDLNCRLWSLAGYDEPPRIESMVSDLAAWVGSGSYSFRKPPHGLGSCGKREVQA